MLGRGASTLHGVRRRRALLASRLLLGPLLLVAGGACGLSLTGSSSSDGGASSSSGATDLDGAMTNDTADGGTAGDGATGCAQDRVLCDGVCVDTNVDVDHCGSCTTKCAAGSATPRCSLGTCAAACGAAEIICGAVCCTGICAANVCKSPVFWVRGDIGVTTGGTFVWADQSGKGNDVSQSSPPLKPTVENGAPNGKPIVKFVNKRLVGAKTNAFQPGTGDLAWFHVSRNDTAQTEKHQVLGTLIDVAPFSGITAGFGPTNLPYGMFRQDTDRFFQGDAGVTTWAVMDGRRVAGKVEIRRSGTLVASGTSNDNVNGGAIVVGAERATGTEWFNGAIAEILLFASTFTDDERRDVAAQLSARWNVPVTP